MKNNEFFEYMYFLLNRYKEHISIKLENLSDRRYIKLGKYSDLCNEFYDTYLINIDRELTEISNCIVIKYDLISFENGYNIPKFINKKFNMKRIKTKLIIGNKEIKL